MYENAKTSSMTTGTNLGVVCAPQAEQLASLCNNIAGASREIDSFSERIRAKLFGERPQETTNTKDPCSIENVLTITKQTLDNAIRTLADIDNRL